MLTPADVLALERSIAADSLSDFVRMAWHTIEPGQPYVHNWHVDALSEHLQAVSDGEITRLLINIPPGTMKSSMTSVFFPAWLWGPAGKPHYRFIGAAHEQTLATRDNRRTRLLVESEWYQARWPVKITSDQNEKTFFETEARGFRQSSAVRSMTGRRSHCLVGGTLVETDIGRVSIKDIATSAVSCNVLTYDSYSKRLVQRPVKAVARREAKYIYRVHTSSGVMVDCSGDHPFYTDRGYIQARFLSANDVLLSAMRCADQKKHIPDEKSIKARDKRAVLQPELLNDVHEQQAWKNWPILQRLWKKDARRAAQKTVFDEMQKRGSDKKGRSQKTEPAGHALQDVWQGGHGQDKKLHTEVLQQHMQGGIPFNGNDRWRKPGVAWRCGQKTVYSNGTVSSSEGKGGDDGPGCGFVRRLRIGSQTKFAPYRHGCDKQRGGKSGHTVHHVPREIPCQSAHETANDTVAMVEKTGRTEVVYDLQIAGTQCFFANGILVHNCIVWDDPLNPEDAYSQTHRETAIRIFTETLPSRMIDPISSAIIIVMQRLHQEDVSGYILENDFGYEHLMLPMEFEPARKCRTLIGFEDPRTEENELLFPERFPREVVDRDKNVMGSFATAGQFQQRPAPREGAMFTRANFEIIDAVPVGCRWVRAWDLAATADRDAAYTAGVLMGISPTGEIIISDVVRDQVSPAGLEKLLRTTAALDGKGINGSIPQDPGSSGKYQAQVLIKGPLAGYAYKASTETGDKISRASPFAAQVEIGNVKLLRGEWNRAYLEEVGMFPGAKYKDQVDASSRAYGELTSRKPFVWHVGGA